MTNTNPIGSRITEARDAAGLTDRDLAEACDVSARTIRTWRLVDASRIRNRDMFYLADVLSVDPTWLLAGDHHVVIGQTA